MPIARSSVSSVITTPLSQILAAPFPGYVLKFADLFTSFAGDPNGIGDWGTQYLPGQNRTNANNSELQEYCDRSIGINPFSLPTAKGLRITGSSAAVTGVNPDGLPYNSGLITTANSSGVPGIFGMQYGYFAVRARFMAGKAFWPAIWLRHAAGFIDAVELDIVEFLGQDTTKIYQSVHWGSASSPSQTINTATITDGSENYHEYSVDWRPDNIIWYVDREETNQVPTPEGFDAPLIFMVNFAIGGSPGFAGTPDGTTIVPANMDIDYAAAWANASSTNISGSRVLA